ncbi:MAG: hypothetical protein ACLTYN_16280 [Dysosmobacter welbionis]
MKASALAAVEKALLPPGMEQLNEAVLIARRCPIAAAETLPFLADKRLVVAGSSAPSPDGEGDDRLGNTWPASRKAAC